jgi:hypothetical protein
MAFWSQLAQKEVVRVFGRWAVVGLVCNGGLLCEGRFFEIGKSGADTEV